MGKTIRLTMAQAVAHFLKAQMTVVDGKKVPMFAGVWAIFGHGNVAGMGEALYQVRGELPTLRAHNEQGMAHAAVAFAKASFRQRVMACTTSIGPGALNMVTAAGVAHVNRLPVLFLPGDVFANRIPDPVLQQIEDFGDGTVSVNDAFRFQSDIKGAKLAIFSKLGHAPMEEDPKATAAAVADFLPTEPPAPPAATAPPTPDADQPVAPSIVPEKD